eukprot:CRZ05799.1 hypothetical protein [Spongospora subterranea]
MSAPKQRRIMDSSFGFAAGVMLSASFWSLLNPALELSKQSAMFAAYPFVPVSLGFIAGCVFVHGADWCLKEYHLDITPSSPSAKPDADDKVTKHKSQTQWRRTLLIVIAITAHNIPEGLAVGVAFMTNPIPRAKALAFAIGLQNFPEGLAVSLPLYRSGVSLWKAVFMGQLSGMVEPISGVVGAHMVSICRPLLPWTMAFASGAMVFVVFDDILPESTSEGNTRLSSWSAIVGFVVMMTLDLLL